MYLHRAASLCASICLHTSSYSVQIGQWMEVRLESFPMHCCCLLDQDQHFQQHNGGREMSLAEFSYSGSDPPRSGPKCNCTEQLACAHMSNKMPVQKLAALSRCISAQNRQGAEAQLESSLKCHWCLPAQGQNQGQGRCGRRCPWKMSQRGCMDSTSLIE